MGKTLYHFDEMVLNDQQKQLIDENHNLIYGFAISKRIDINEYYDVLAIGLCKAALIFDPGKQLKFSTIAYTCMMNEYTNYLRRNSAKTRMPDGGVVSYEVLSDNTPVEHYVIDMTLPYVKWFMDNKLTQRQKNVLVGLMYGYTEVDLARMFGTSRQYIHTIKLEIREVWNRMEKIIDNEVNRKKRKRGIT